MIVLHSKLSISLCKRIHFQHDKTSVYSFTHPLCVVSAQTALALADYKPLIDNVSNPAVFVVCATIQQQRKIYSIQPFLGSHAEIKL